MPQSLDELIRRVANPANWDRVPGLYRRWELEQVIEAGFEYRVETSGCDDTGMDLHAVYRRESSDNNDTNRMTGIKNAKHQNSV